MFGCRVPDRLDIIGFIYNHKVVNDLSLTFIALSDPTRRMILDRLRTGAATVNQLAEPFGMSQQAVSKHLAYLERASLIEKQREGRQQFCSLRAAALKDAHAWIETYRQFWDGALDRLDVFLADEQRRLKEKKSHARRPKRTAR